MSPWWTQLALAMAGGALGAGARFVIGDGLLRSLGYGFPWGTLVVNLLGSLAAGFLLVWLQDRGTAALVWRAFLMVGLIGAFTTWSTLVLELHLLSLSQGFGTAVLYLATSLVGSLALLMVGMHLAESLRNQASIT